MKLNAVALASALAAAALPACKDAPLDHNSHCSGLQLEFNRLSTKLLSPINDAACSRDLPTYLTISDVRKKLDSDCRDKINSSAYDKVMKQVESSLEQSGCLPPSGSASSAPSASPAKIPVLPPVPKTESESEGR